MANIRVHGPPVDLEEPALVEGFPGLGLVGKIATDHLIDELGMAYHASIHCEGLPLLGTYQADDRTIRPPVRIYVSESANLYCLQSDTPVSAGAVRSVADCLTAWIEDRDATPIYLSGLPAERDGEPSMFGVATGDAGSKLDEHGLDGPDEAGAVSGPTGALLNRAAANEQPAIALVVESSPQFPDPEAARVLVEDGIGPIADVDVDVSELVEHAADIRRQREELAKQMREVTREESSQARPMQMYQ